MFLVMINNFWSFSWYCLIYLLFDINTFAWKTEWEPLRVLVDLTSDICLVSLNECFHFVIELWWVFVIAYACFMRNKITENSENGLIENTSV